MQLIPKKQIFKRKSQKSNKPQI